MVRHALIGFAFVALGLGRDPGCGGVDDPDGGTNAPCTRNSDCRGGLVCSEGVCTEPGTKTDSGSIISPVKDSGTGDASREPEDAGDGGD